MSFTRRTLVGILFHCDRLEKLQNFLTDADICEEPYEDVSIGVIIRKERENSAFFALWEWASLIRCQEFKVAHLCLMGVCRDVRFEVTHVLRTVERLLTNDLLE